MKKHFGKYGSIRFVKVVKDFRSGRSKGFAFVTFSNTGEAKKALAAHGKVFKERALVVRIAKKRSFDEDRI